MTETATPGPPDDTPAYMYPAWASALMWASGDARALAQFRADTGCAWTPPTSGLDRLIDDATGVGETIGPLFVEWFNRHVWGPMDGGGHD